MSDETDKKDNIGSLIKTLQGMKYPVLPDSLKNIKNSPYYKLAEEIKASQSFLNIQTIGIASINSDHASKLKQLAEYGRTNPSIKLPYEPSELAARFDSLANHYAIKRTMSGFADVGKALAHFAKMYSFLAPPAGEMAWFESHVNSALFKYLSSNLGGSLKPENFVELEGAATISTTATAEAFVIEAAPSLEAEIVEQLERGAGLSDLSDKARQYLIKWWPYFKAVIDFFVYFITFQQYYEAQISEAKSPAELRAIVGSMPAEHKEFMEGERIVIRDSLILRAGPNKQSEELGRMKLGTRLEVKAERGSWIQVSVELNGDELEGWVYGPYTLKL
jgi:hypothetical protein